jgi:hypothetical protein
VYGLAAQDFVVEDDGVEQAVRLGHGSEIVGPFWERETLIAAGSATKNPTEVLHSERARIASWNATF